MMCLTSVIEDKIKHFSAGDDFFEIYNSLYGIFCKEMLFLYSWLYGIKKI